MALWNLPEDDFLSKRRGERGGASAFKRKATTSQKSNGKKASNQYSKKLTSSSNKKKKNTVAPKQATRKRETEAQASRIRNACVAVICVIFLAVFLADFKGCSSTKKTSSFELPTFSLSSVIDSIADAISGGSHSSSNSYDYSYDPLNYVTDVELKSDVYLIRNTSSEDGDLFICLYQIPEMKSNDDYINSFIESELLCRKNSSESYDACTYGWFISDYYSFYNTTDSKVKKIVEVNSGGWRRNNNNKPFISVSNFSREGAYGLNSVEGNEYAVSILDGDGNQVKLIENVVVHEVTYPEMDEIIKGWVEKFDLDEKSKYDYY